MNIENFSKYDFGLDGSVYHIRLKRFLIGWVNKGGYLKFSLRNDNNEQKSIQQQNIVYKLFNKDYQLFQGHKLVVGHLNSNTLDNHISNLCLMTHRENCSIEKTQKSGLPVGICFEKRRNKYKTQIWINGKRKALGYFLTPEEASATYQEALKNNSK